jgi:hypothetical protein
VLVSISNTGARVAAPLSPLNVNFKTRFFEAIPGLRSHRIEGVVLILANRSPVCLPMSEMMISNRSVKVSGIFQHIC